VLKKLTFSRTGIALIDQIRAALDSEAYPCHHRGHERREARPHPSQRLLAEGAPLPGHLPGLPFHPRPFAAENDAHVLRAIGAEGKYKALFISLHGDPNSEANLAVQRRAATVASERGKRSPAVHFYGRGFGVRMEMIRPKVSDGDDAAAEAAKHESDTSSLLGRSGLPEIQHAFVLLTWALT